MKPREIVQEGYDAIAPDYLAARMASHPDVKLLEELVERLPRGAKVLDAGCGAGIPITRFLSWHFDVIGVDISPAQINLALTSVPSARFVRQDLTKLGLDDDSFDAVTCFYAIFHIEKEKQQGVIENFCRLLKPGGLLLICFAASETDSDEEELFFGAPMFFSAKNKRASVEMVTQSGCDIVWEKLVADPLDDSSEQLFVLAQKKSSE